jgi:Sigma-70, region 4
MTDRVSERRRAAQLARHYRDQEGLTIAEIARRLGRAESTVKAYLYDPSGAKAREVKARYRGVCRGCGAPTAPRNGKGDAYAYCKRCHPGAIARQWTRERVRKAMRAWRARTALRRPPTTGRARTHAGAAAKRSNDYRPENGPRRPP